MKFLLDVTVFFTRDLSNILFKRFLDNKKSVIQCDQKLSNFDGTSKPYKN